MTVVAWPASPARFQWLLGQKGDEGVDLKKHIFSIVTAKAAAVVADNNEGGSVVGRKYLYGHAFPFFIFYYYHGVKVSLFFNLNESLLKVEPCIYIYDSCTLLERYSSSTPPHLSCTPPTDLMMPSRDRGMLEVNYGVIATVAAAAVGRTYMKFVRGPEPKSVDMSGKVRHGRRLRVATGPVFDE